MEEERKNRKYDPDIFNDDTCAPGEKYEKYASCGRGQSLKIVQEFCRKFDGSWKAECAGTGIDHGAAAELVNIHGWGGRSIDVKFEVLRSLGAESAGTETEHGAIL